MGFLDPLLAPLLEYNPAYLIIVVSIVLSALITYIYKLMTNQQEMKSLKDGIKKDQEEMKKHRDNPKKLMEIQKKAMEKNMQYMMKSMKPTLITFIPLILVFGWLNAHFTYNPLMPGEEFTVTARFAEGSSGSAEIFAPDGLTVTGDISSDIIDGTASWTLSGEEGSYLIDVNHEGTSKSREIIITKQHNYAPTSVAFKDSSIKTIDVEMSRLRIFGENFSIFGWHPGWLGTYIIISLVASMLLRKALKLH